MTAAFIAESFSFIEGSPSSATKISSRMSPTIPFRQTMFRHLMNSGVPIGNGGVTCDVLGRVNTRAPVLYMRNEVIVCLFENNIHCHVNFLRVVLIVTQDPRVPLYVSRLSVTFLKLFENSLIVIQEPRIPMNVNKFTVTFDNFLNDF